MILVDAYAAEFFNLVNVVLQDGGLGASMEAVELGEVVHLDVVDDSWSKAIGFVSFAFYDHNDGMYHLRRPAGLYPL